MIDTGLLSELIMLEFQKKRFFLFCTFQEYSFDWG